MNKLMLALAVVFACLVMSADRAPASPRSEPTGEPTPTFTIWLPLLLKSCCTLISTPTPTPTASATPSPTATATATATSAPAADVQVAPWCSQWDAPGNDNDNLNEEYVCFENQGGSAADMTDWHVQDAVSTTYTFPAFMLAAGAHVQLHTGSGVDTATDLYWGRGQAVWTNTGDTVYLYDAGWGLVDEYTY
jgi:competence protein ComEC